MAEVRTQNQSRWINVPNGPPRSAAARSGGPPARSAATPRPQGAAPQDSVRLSAEASANANSTNSANSANSTRTLASGMLGTTRTSSNSMIRGATAVAGLSVSGTVSVSTPSLGERFMSGLRRLGNGLRRLGGDLIRGAGNFTGFIVRNVTGSPEAAQRVRDIANGAANFIDPRPTPVYRPDAQAPARRANGIPEALDRHDYGPPATPSRAGDIARDLDPATGRPRTGTLSVEETENGHRYSTRNALPAGLSREQAEQIFNRYNAPTTQALYGNGNDPSATQGSVDPRISLGNPDRLLNRIARPLLSPFGGMGG